MIISILSCQTEVLNIFLPLWSESVFKVRQKDMFSVRVDMLAIDFCLACKNRLLSYKNSPVGWQASGGRELPVLLHKLRCCSYLFTVHYLFISEQCIHICLHIPNGDKRKSGQNESFEFYLVSWKVSASVSLKFWVREEISHLKRKKCLPCFASIIQQPNSPLGNTEWVLRPLNESKSWASVSHACLSWNNFRLTHIPEPTLCPLLKMIYGPAGLAARLQQLYFHMMHS